MTTCGYPSVAAYRLLLIMLGEGLLIALLLVLGGRFLERRLNRSIYPGV